MGRRQSFGQFPSRDTQLGTEAGTVEAPQLLFFGCCLSTQTSPAAPRAVL